MLAAEDLKLSRHSLLGRWEGSDTNGLICATVFEETKGRVHTFRQAKHLTTVNFWWNIEPNGTNVVLGVNGYANKLPKDQLRLHLQPVNTNLITVRDVILSRALPK